MTKCFLKRKIRELELELMNARQAAKAAAKKIEELEDFNRRASADIKAYNACIDGVIAGQMTFCDWCEENPECKLEAKGKGCSLWWLKEITPEDVKTYVLSSNEEGSDESKGILGASPEG